MFITDCALRFKELGDADGKFQLIYNRLKLTGNSKVEGDQKSSSYGIRIDLTRMEGERKGKRLAFVVQGLDAQRACERIKEEVANTHSEALRFMDQETLLKLDILAKKPHLRELFLEQVKGKDAIFGEEEFWQNNQQAIIDEVGPEKFEKMLSLKLVAN